ncbi:Uncharacterised protein [Vibrio cholerae]|nr:Uncharacterised protein [Vibrio cholerae]CSC46567.1 Uncharacterised protein [Vibrio cholerae]CSI55498.1 Uncharacterised protein [Vibrio cholerae]
MMPKPPCTRLSNQLIGQGLSISKKRNSTKPVTSHFQSKTGNWYNGTISIVIQKPANSSQTIEP